MDCENSTGYMPGIIVAGASPNHIESSKLFSFASGTAGLEDNITYYHSPEEITPRGQDVEESATDSDYLDNFDGQNLNELEN